MSRTRMGRRWAALAAAGLLAVLASRGRAAELPGAALERLQEALQEGEPAFTKDELDATVRQVRPLVEKATGRTFQAPPKVTIADRATVAASLGRDLLPQLRYLAEGQSELQLRLAAAQQAQMFVVCLLGKYGFEDQTLYVMPRNFAPLLSLTKTDPKHTAAILKIIVAHELTHALQDQEIGLAKRLRQPRDLEAMQALNATIEGHAVFVQDQVGHALGLGDAVLETARLLSAGAVEFEDPALQFLGKLVGTQFEQIYLGGRKFIAHHHAQGGMERVWQIVAQPPAATSMIARPETYSPTRRAELDYAAVLEGLEARFGARPWQVRNLELGHMLVRSAYASVEPKAREELLANVVRVQSLIAQCREPLSMADVSLMVLKDAAFAPRMLTILEATARANVEKMKASAVLSVSGLRVERFGEAAAGKPAGSKVSFTVRGPGGMIQKHVFVRVHRGAALVELHEFNVGLTDEQFAGIADTVFQRYHAARGAGPAPAPK